MAGKYEPRVLGRVSDDDLTRYTTWCAQGFKAGNFTSEEASNLCRITERWTGRVIAYVPTGEGHEDSAAIIDIICHAAGGGSER